MPVEDNNEELVLFKRLFLHVKNTFENEVYLHISKPLYLLWIGNNKQFINSPEDWSPAFVCLIVNLFVINKPIIYYSISFKSDDNVVVSKIDIILSKKFVFDKSITE